jgi:hypothetical protein
MPSLPSISVKGASLVSDYQRQVEAAPQAADFAKEAKATVTTNPDGSWVATVKGEENIKRAIEMRDGSRRVEVERGQKLAASRPAEKLVTQGGREVAFPAHLSERIAKKRGWKPKINWGRPTESYVVRDGELVRVK